MLLKAVFARARICNMAHFCCDTRRSPRDVPLLKRSRQVFMQLARRSGEGESKNWIINPVVGPEAVTGSSRMKVCVSRQESECNRPLLPNAHRALLPFFLFPLVSERLCPSRCHTSSSNVLPLRVSSAMQGGSMTQIILNSIFLPALHSIMADVTTSQSR